MEVVLHFPMPLIGHNIVDGRGQLGLQICLNLSQRNTHAQYVASGNGCFCFYQTSLVILFPSNNHFPKRKNLRGRLDCCKGNIGVALVGDQMTNPFGG